ncbi:dynein light chain 9, partial [Coccomyxa subellipsoidea C-169]
LDDAEVDALIRETIVLTLGSDSQFDHNNMNQWTNEIIEGCLKRLAGLGKPFKYVVPGDLLQVGAGLHSACTARWNDKTDGKLTVQWENRTVLVLATAYWLAV